MSFLLLFKIDSDSVEVELTRERIKKIAYLEHLKKIEVLRLRWNLITKLENLHCVSATLTELDLSDNQVFFL